MSARNWEKVLLDLGFDVPLNRHEFSVPCPWHEDKHPSLSINIDKGVYICHAGCSEGKLNKFVSDYLGISLLAAERLAIDDIAKPLNLFPESILEREHFDTINTIPGDFSSVPKWVLARGFSLECLSRWECGLNPVNSSLIIPVKDKYSNNIGWIERFPPSSNFRYKNSDNLEKSSILFGHSRLDNPRVLFITEGSLDCIWLDQHGFSSVAILGAYLSKKQTQLVKEISPNEVVLCFDMDEAGRNAIEKSRRYLEKYCIVSWVKLPNGYKDVQDIRDSLLLNDVLNERYII